jgi:hypothetical protein
VGFSIKRGSMAASTSPETVPPPSYDWVLKKRYFCELALYQVIDWSVNHWCYPTFLRSGHESNVSPLGHESARF